MTTPPPHEDDVKLAQAITGLARQDDNSENEFYEQCLDLVLEVTDDLRDNIEGLRTQNAKLSQAGAISILTNETIQSLRARIAELEKENHFVRNELERRNESISICEAENAALWKALGECEVLLSEMLFEDYSGYVPEIDYAHKALTAIAQLRKDQGK